jgi:hypothetical protein
LLLYLLSELFDWMFCLLLFLMHLFLLACLLVFCLFVCLLACLFWLILSIFFRISN